MFNTCPAFGLVFNTVANRKRPRFIGIWVTERGVEDIDRRAIEAGLLRPNGEPNRSAMVRDMLAYASAHMPRKRASK